MLDPVLLAAFVAGYFSVGPVALLRGLIEPKISRLLRSQVSSAKSALPKVCKSGIVDHPPLRDCLTNYFTSKRCGLYVLGGPAGSGESTMLGVVIDKFRSDDSKRRILYFVDGITILRDKLLNEMLGIAEDCSISSAVDPGTVIILDHCDFVGELPDDDDDYLRTLVKDSYESEKFQLLVVTCKAKMMYSLLNEHEYMIKLLCAPELLKWKAGQIDELVEDIFDHWAEPERAKLAKAVMQCPLPSAVAFVMAQSQHRANVRGTALSQEEIVQLANDRVARRRGAWSAFDCIQNTMQYEYFCLLHPNLNVKSCY